MIKSNIVDISLFPKDSIAVVYEDKESKKRDVRFFKERVTQEEIDAFQSVINTHLHSLGYDK